MINTTFAPQTKNTFENLYTLYFPLVQRICYRYTKNGEDALDLTQEIFLKVRGNYQSFEGNCQPSTWLYRVAVNHCLDHLRWKKRQGELLAGYREESDRQEPQSSESDADSPVKRILRTLLDGLDAANQQVVFLRFEVGMTHAEIAEICGVSRVAVTKRLAKFQEKVAGLKEELGRAMRSGGYAGEEMAFAHSHRAEFAEDWAG